MRDVAGIRDFILTENPAAATKVAGRLIEAFASLEHFPERGEAVGRDTRRLVVAGLPYTVFYRIGADHVRILAVRHQKRR